MIGMTSVFMLAWQK